MVDVIKSLPVEYIFASPGSSFRSLHESVVNYGGNKPEFITCTHEEIGVAMGNGYAKIEGKPALSMAHGTVGCQHAAMAVYNAYCDQVPNILILGNISNAAERRGSVEWLHSVQDAAAMIREFTKWDDNPASLQHFGESTVRAYQLAMTPPTMPVVLVADGELQENAIPADANLRIPKYVVPAPPAGDQSTVNEVAKMLVAAENPVIVTSRSARTPAGLEIAGRTGGTSAMRGDRSAPAHELPVAASAESVVEFAVHRGECRPDPGTRNLRFLRRRPRIGRTDKGDPALHHQAGNETRQHQFERSVLQEQLPELPALRRCRYRHRGRRGSDAPLAHRGGEEADHRGSQARLPGPRRQAGRGEQAERSSRTGPTPPMPGTPAPSAPRACRRSSGRRSRTRTGRWFPTRSGSATGRFVCGTSTSIITTSAARAAKAWAIWLRRLWARPSPTRSMAA